MKQSFEELLIQTESYWQEANKNLYVDPSKDINRALKFFFIIELKRNTTNHPKDLELWDIWVGNTAPLVERCITNISISVDSLILDRKIQWISEDWESWQELCCLRSTLTFLKKAYSEEIDIDDLNRINLKQIDEFLEQVEGEGHLPSHLVPEGIPDNHWWWRYPVEQ